MCQHDRSEYRRPGQEPRHEIGLLLCQCRSERVHESGLVDGDAARDDDVAADRAATPELADEVYQVPRGALDDGRCPGRARICCAEDRRSSGAPVVHRRLVVHGACQCGRIRDRERPQQRGQQAVIGQALVVGKQGGSCRIAHDAGRTRLIAQHPAPATREQVVTGGIPGDPDGAGACDEGDALLEASRRDQQCGVVDDDRVDALIPESDPEGVTVLVGIAALGTGTERRDVVAVGNSPIETGADPARGRVRR